MSTKIFLMGGLGNQLFQVGLYLYLINKFQDNNFSLDSSWFKISTRKSHEIPTVSAIFPNLNYTCSDSVNYPLILNPVFRNCLKILIHLGFPINRYSLEGLTDPAANGYISNYYLGFWQQAQFADSLFQYSALDSFSSFKADFDGHELFMFPSNTSVAIHVRRGDYLTNKNYLGIRTHTALTAHYFVSAIDHMIETLKTPSFYIFTDDQSWFEEIVEPLYPNVFFWHINGLGLSPLQEFLILFNFKAFIVSNSTFSWWPAYFSSRINSAKVVAPRNYLLSASLPNSPTLIE